MKTIALKIAGFIFFCACLFTAILLNSPKLTAQPFKLFAVYDLDRVFEDGYNLPALHDTLSTFGIRGEVISGQCALQTKKGLTNVTVMVSGLSNKKSGKALPASAVEWNFVGSIPLSKNTPNQPVRELVRQAPARFPDYLMSERQINIAPKAYQSIYLTINIPENAEAGTYTGSITVKCLQGDQTLPVCIEVYPLNLPSTRHLKVTEWYSTGDFAHFHGIQEKYSDAWFSTDLKLQDFKVSDTETGKQQILAGKDVIPVLLPAFESHLRQKGWLDKTLFHIKDEPSMHNAAAWREMSSYIHHYAPDLRRIDAIETTNLLDDIEVAVPKLDALGTWYESYRNAVQKGTELWFYTVGIYQGSLYPNKTIDMPVMNSRILHWLNYKYDATGYLHWGWNQWEEKPYEEVGMHIGGGALSCKKEITPGNYGFQIFPEGIHTNQPHREYHPHLSFLGGTVWMDRARNKDRPKRKRAAGGPAGVFL